MGNEWKARAEAVLAAGPATFSKSWLRFPHTAPVALVSGEGSYVTGADGHTYIDCIGALGANLLGHGHAAVNAAVHRQIDQGVAFSLMHPLEVEVAEQLVALVPGAEQARFMLNGADACNAALRLARAITGQAHVVFCGFHGGGNDSYMVTTSMDAGLLPLLKDFNHQARWGQWEAVLAALARGNVAALMLEVPPRPWGESEAVIASDLAMLADACRHHHALFILDEVVTCLRYGLGGAAHRYGVVPDLVCMGKALANGYPLAALLGPTHLMGEIERRGVFISSTHGGNALGLAAAMATLNEVQGTPALTTLHMAGMAIGTSLYALFRQYALPVTLMGNEARMVLQWHEGPQTKALRTLWMQEMLRRRILVGGPYFPQSCMDQEVITAIHRAAVETCALLAEALADGTVEQRLLGGPIETDVFGQRYTAAQEANHA